MIRKIFILFILFVSPILVNAKSDAKIELVLDPSEVAVGESFNLSIAISGLDQADLNNLNLSLPGVEKMEITNKSQSSKMEIVNNVSKSISQIDLSMISMNEGSYTLGPIKLALKDGTTLTSNSVEIKITKGAVLPAITTTPQKKKSFFNDTEKEATAKEQKSKKNDKGWLINILAASLLAVMVYKLYKQQFSNKQFSDSKLIDFEKEKTKSTEVKKSRKFFDLIKLKLLNVLLTKDKETASDVKNSLDNHLDNVPSGLKRKQEIKNSHSSIIKTEVSESEENKIPEIPRFEDDKFFEKSKAYILGFIQKTYNFDTEALATPEILEKLRIKGVADAGDFGRCLNYCDQGIFSFDKSKKDEVLQIINNLNK